MLLYYFSWRLNWTIWGQLDKAVWTFDDQLLMMILHLMLAIELHSVFRKLEDTVAETLAEFNIRIVQIRLILVLKKNIPNSSPLKILIQIIPNGEIRNNLSFSLYGFTCFDFLCNIFEVWKWKPGERLHDYWILWTTGF